MRVKIDFSKDHEDRLHLSVVTEPGVTWHEVLEPLYATMHDLTAVPRRASIDEQNARAFLAAEASYLQEPSL